MANEVMNVMDPFGKTVHLPAGICDHGTTGKDVYDDVTSVIEKPAMLVEARENEKTRYYYFRSIGWESTLLIVVELKNDRWEAVECKKNPSGTELSSVLKQGKQII